MPTYDYVCDACGHAFEFFQSITSNPKRTCPQCGRRKLRRLIGTGAAILIGGSSSGRGPESDAGAETTSSDSTPDSGDATPEAKTGDDPGEKTTPAESPTPEKKISGSTSTPTHEAREGRGVGNLVDAVRRQRKEGPDKAKKTGKQAAKKSPAKKTPAKKVSGKQGGSRGAGGRGSGGSKSKK